VQGGDNPVRLRVDPDQLQTTVIPIPDAPQDGGTPENVTPGEPSPDDPTGDPGAGGSMELGFEIDTAQAYAIWKAEIATFLDARDAEDYEDGHIAEAFFFDYHAVDRGETPEVIDAVLSSDAPIVIYCTGGDCDASHNAAVILQSLGFKQLHVYVDGYDAWVAAGHETETGPDIFSEETP